MRYRWIAASALFICAHGAAVGASKEEAESQKRLVMSVIERMDAAVAAKDLAAIGAVTVPEGNRTVSYRGREARDTYIRMDFKDYAQMVGRSESRSTRITDPKIEIDDSVAAVWGRFVTTMDGKVAGCGTLHYDLVSKDGEWRILNSTSVERNQGCTAG